MSRVLEAIEEDEEPPIDIIVSSETLIVTCNNQAPRLDPISDFEHFQKNHHSKGFDQ